MNEDRKPATSLIHNREPRGDELMCETLRVKFLGIGTPPGLKGNRAHAIVIRAVKKDSATGAADLLCAII